VCAKFGSKLRQAQPSPRPSEGMLRSKNTL
jgi:hypothetical protein